MFGMLLRSRRYAGRFFKRRSWDLYTPQKVEILMVRGIHDSRRRTAWIEGIPTPLAPWSPPGFRPVAQDSLPVHQCRR